MKNITHLLLSFGLLLAPFYSIKANAEELPKVEAYFELSLPLEVKMHSPDGSEIDFNVTSLPGIEMLEEGHYLVYGFGFSEMGYYFSDKTGSLANLEMKTFDHESKKENVFNLPKVEKGDKIGIGNYDSIFLERADGKREEYAPMEAIAHPGYEFKVTKEEKKAISGYWFFLALPVILIPFIFLKIKKRSGSSK